jgi:hypothetical protein
MVVHIGRGEPLTEGQRSGAGRRLGGVYRRWARVEVLAMTAGSEVAGHQRGTPGGRSDVRGGFQLALSSGWLGPKWAPDDDDAAAHEEAATASVGAFITTRRLEAEEHYDSSILGHKVGNVERRRTCPQHYVRLQGWAWLASHVGSGNWGGCGAVWRSGGTVTGHGRFGACACRTPFGRWASSNLGRPSTVDTGWPISFLSIFQNFRLLWAWDYKTVFLISKNL